VAVVASLSILLLSGASLFTQASAGPESAAVPTPYVKVTVAPGQTLWSIASSIPGHGDRRDVVDEIVSINHLESPELFAGQKIFIPTRH
jgi:LysM repeat protein